MKKKGRLPIWFWRNSKVVRLMKKVRGFFFRGKWDFSIEENKSKHLFFFGSLRPHLERFFSTFFWGFWFFLAERTRGEIFFWERTCKEFFLRENTRRKFYWERTWVELRGSNRTLWTADSVAHMSHVFRKGISDMR